MFPLIHPQRFVIYGIAYGEGMRTIFLQLLNLFRCEVGEERYHLTAMACDDIR